MYQEGAFHQQHEDVDSATVAKPRQVARRTSVATPAAHKPLPAVPVPSIVYPAGPIRRDHDDETTELARRIRRFSLTDPSLAHDLARMDPPVAAQFAATARTPFEHHERRILADEGVDMDWSRDADFDNIKTSDDFL